MTAPHAAPGPMLILELKTAPDPAVGKRLLALEKFSDAEAELAMRTLSVAEKQTAALPLSQRRIVAAALVIAEHGHFAVEAFAAQPDEAAMLAALEARVAALALPVMAWDAARAPLLLRALATGVPLPALLAGQGPRSLAEGFGLAAQRLAELAAVRGLPHRLGLCTAGAEAAHAAGEGERLAAGCAVDALIAYLLALGCKAATGEITGAQAESAQAEARSWLAAQQAAHWRAFHQQWRAP